MANLLEKQIERSVCEYAKSIGFLVYKFTSPERAAVPDRMFITPKGKVFFIEFKREGAKVTPAQARNTSACGTQSLVFVVDSVEKARTAVEFQSGLL